jgi:SdrD B-like domain/Putative Ig domain
MNTVALTLRRLALLMGATLMLLLPFSASAQTSGCTNCLNLGLTGGIVNAHESDGDGTLPASGGTGLFAITITNSVATILPNGGPYTGWCATDPNASVSPNGTYASTSSFSLGSPAANEINYILNHKQGTVFEVQNAIWAVQGTVPVANLDATALAMYTAAISPAGQAFFPGPGQIVAVLLTVQNNPGAQNILVEVHSPCSQLGDFVWNDSNSNGIQDAGEVGINGVTVTLKDQNGNPLATTVTGPAPAGYVNTSLTPGAPGYYQFTQLCAGTYQVAINLPQAPLSGFTPTSTLVGTDRTIDSNVNSAPVTLPAASVDETIDFGFVGPSPVTVVCSSATGQVGVFYSSSVTASGGVPSYTFSLAAGSTLPPGLTLNATTGLISGVPTTSGPFSFQIQVVDSTGTQAGTTVTNCSITIAPPSISLLCAANTGTVGTFYSSSLIASGGSGTYTYSISAGSLPPGLSLNATTGVISGTPTTDGSFSFTAMATDTTQNKAATTTSQCTIVIAPPKLSLLCATSTGTVGTVYSSALVASGGTAPYTYSISSGSLPPGLTLNATTGAITGTPTADGTFSFTAMVTDSTKSTAATTTSQCTIVIAPPTLSLLCATSTGTVGTVYSSALVASGGTAPYTYSISVGALPGGLSLNPATGAITGTPTTAGTFSFTAMVTDSTKATAASTTSNCTIIIAPKTQPNTLTVSCGSSAAQAGVPYSSSVVVTGGTPGYTFSVATGALPAGLSLNTSTGAITGTPTTSGNYSFTIKVVDSLGASAFSSCIGTCGSNNPTSYFFNSPSGTLGNSQVYTSGGITVTAYGFTNAGAPTALNGNNNGGDQNGLGIDADSINQIDTTNFVQLDVQAAMAAGAQNAMMLVDSVASGQAFNVYGSNTLGSIGTLLLSNQTQDGTPFALPNFGTYKYYSVRAAAGYVLLEGVTFSFGNCVIVVAPPIDLECGSCGAGKATVGVFYSSTLTVTGGKAPFTFALATGSTLPPGLSLNTTTGVISGTPTTAGTYTFTTTVKDANGATDTATCTIVVVVPPIDLECGSCGQGRGTVGTPYSSQFQVNGGVAPFTFSVISGSLPPGLTLNATTGVLSGTPTTAGTYTFTTKVVDKNGTTDTTTCTIYIVGSPIDLECGSCGSGKATVGMSYSSQLAVNYGTAPYTFSIISGSLPPGLTLNTTTGVISGTPTTAGTYSFTSKVVDAHGNSDTATCTIVVVTAPVNLDCGTCGASNAKVGTPYSVTFALSGGTAPFTYSVTAGSLPPGLTLNTTTGVLSGTPTTAGTYTFTTKVVDKNGSYDTATCTIIVTGSTINLDCGTCGVSKGTVGTAYSATYSVTGGTSPYTFTIISGSLPPGLSLGSSTGKISGTPTTAGTYTFTAKVVDAHGNSDTQSCTITIVAMPINLDCGSCGSGNATVGTAYSTSFSLTGGTGPFTYSLIAGSLPPGLTLNATTGVISGTPTTAGTYNFTTKVVDHNGSYDTASCSIIVINSALDLQCGSCGTGKATVGTAYSSALSVTGGTGPFTYSIYSGSLPPGLTLNASTGVISGTPTTAGTYTVTSKVVDYKGKTDTATCTFVVLPAPINLDCGPCGASKGTVGTAYSATMKVTGGTGPFTFSIYSGTLPPGLTLNATTGVISGTPTQAGTWNFTSKVVDKNGASDTDTCTIVVTASAVNIGCGSCGTGKGYVGTAYSSTFSVTGGSGSDTFSIVSGYLPTGLSLNTTTGKISGNPTKAGTYTFTTKVVDANGTTDTTTCTIVIATSTCN